MPERREHEQWIDTATGVHEQNATCDVACVMHNPSDGTHRELRLHWRGDRGIFERICAHGVGHPDPDQRPYWEATAQEHQGIHGCDGCCGAWHHDE